MSGMLLDQFPKYEQKFGDLRGSPDPELLIETWDSLTVKSIEHIKILVDWLEASCS